MMNRPNRNTPKTRGLANKRSTRSMSESITRLPRAWSSMTKNTQRQQSKNPNTLRIVINMLRSYENKSNGE